METTRICMTEEILRLLERATDEQLDLVWRFLRGLVA